jgi:FAD-dependent urate hydroxylase
VSDGARLRPDRIVYACGYAADLARVPHLAGLDVARRDGFPELDHAMRTSLPGLCLPGFAATRDFGPFFGFVRGAPAAAALIARDLSP